MTMKSQISNVIRYELLLVIAIAFASTIPGCASSRIKAAENVGTVGKAAATQAKTAILATSDEFYKTKLSETFLYGASKDTSIKEALRDDITKLDASYNILLKKAAVFDNLEKMYTAFYALCSYDASSQAESALASAMSAVNSYAKSINKPEPFASTTPDIVAHTGGLLASEIQFAMIKASNKRIITILKSIHTLFSDRNTRDQFVTSAKVFAAKRYAATKYLYNVGALDPSALYTEVICDNHFTLKKDFKPTGIQQIIINESINASIDFYAAEKFKSIESNYDICLDLLQQLITAHERIEANKSIDINEINLIISQIQQFVTIITKQKSTSS